MTQKIYSTGIDIGTTTTHLIISRLSISVKEGFGCAPKVVIDKKEILYMSPIYFTPLDNDGKISASGVRKIIDSEYKKAGFSPEDLKSGAVIITGESARRRNAKELLFEISGYAGDFIVAEAGGESESVLAGKGAGGMALSKNELCRVCTVDIGGGTANIALFEDGKAIAASCIDVGGRLLKLTRSEYGMLVCDVSQTLKPLLESENIKIGSGDILSKSDAKKICRLLAGKLIFELNSFPQADKYIFSGGVSCCMDKQLDDYQYGDLGVILSKEIANSDFFAAHNCTVADNSIRATVIGAGNFSFEISGSTIACFGCELPVKNIPCVKIKVNLQNDIDTCCNGLEKRIDKFSDKKPVAISFDGFSEITADEMLLLAEKITASLSQIIKNRRPVIILIDRDLAKAFGVCLKRYLPSSYPILCIDCVSAGDGDYLDIGESVGEGRAVPVSVKQLVFSV